MENGVKPPTLPFKKMSYDDQMKQVHEAYQFLIKKYKLQSTVANTALMLSATIEHPKTIITPEIKKEEKKGVENPKTVTFDDDEEKKLKRKKSSSLKRNKKTPKNATSTS